MNTSRKQTALNLKRGREREKWQEAFFRPFCGLALDWTRSKSETSLFLYCLFNRYSLSLYSLSLSLSHSSSPETPDSINETRKPLT